MLSLCHGVSNLRDNLQSNRHRMKYLIFVSLLVVVAIASYKIGQSASVARDVEGDAVVIRHKRQEYADSGWTNNQCILYSGGAVYIRWGRTVCGLGSDAIYTGVTGGSFFNSTGGGSNYLCLPLDPTWGAYTESVEKHSKLYGLEYKSSTGFGLNNNHNRPLHDNNVPCVLCRSQTKSSVIMIPARNQCYSGLHTEYTGFLMAENSVHKGRTEFICMDKQPESDPAGFRNENGALFYNVEGVCGSLPCPHYIPRREITCAVCSSDQNVNARILSISKSNNESAVLHYKT